MMKELSGTIQAILGSASDAIVIADAAGTVLAWNPAAERMLGYTADEVVGRSLTVIIPERFHAAHLEGIARVVAGEEPRIIGRTVEVEARRRDGIEIPIELSLGTWVTDGERYFTGIIRNITERRRLMDELAESRARASAVLESANDAIISIDEGGRVIQWNAYAERLFGRTADEMFGEQLDVVIPERFRSLHHAGIARVVAGGETHVIGRTAELSGLHADGHEFPIELSLAAWESAHGRAFTGIVRDISERRRLMDELAESRARAAAVLESANDAIISIDHEGRVIQWNPYAERLFGRTAEEMIGQQLDVVIPERFRSLHHAGIARVVAGGEAHVIGGTAELSGLHADGHEFPIELSLAAWEGAEGQAFTGIVRDITERRRAEETIRQTNEQLAEKNEMLEALSAKLAKYLSRQVYDSIFEGRTEVRVESYRKKLTVFFSDIQGFTELTDRMEAEPVSALLNHYLSEMSDIATAYGGTVDKFIGDGIMIFFGDPETRGEREDALACVRMALAMREKVRELKDEWCRESGAVELNVRIGINTGYCTVGNFGSADRLDYTIVGKEVNAAARLETSAEADQIHISQTTYELIKDEIDARFVGELRVKGLAYPIRTYEVIGPRDATRAPEAEPEAAAAETFRITFDPSQMTPEELARTLASLRETLTSLEQATQGSAPGADAETAEPV